MSGEASSSRRRGDESDDERLPTSSSSIPSTSQSNNPQTSTTGAGGAGEEDAEAAEIAAMKARVAEMEAEAAKLRELTAASEAASQGASNGGEGDVNMSDEDREATDSRSVYVGNVSSRSSLWFRSNSKTKQFVLHRLTMLRHPKRFNNTLLHAVPSTESQSCSTSSRVPRGSFFSQFLLYSPFSPGSDTIHCTNDRYAYVEFAEPSLVAQAVLLNESMFRGRLLKVTPKRTNLPGMSARGRGRGRGRGGYRGGYQGVSDRFSSVTSSECKPDFAFLLF